MYMSEHLCLWIYVCLFVFVHMFCVCVGPLCVYIILIILFLCLQQMKSTVAARAIKHMNPAINVIAHQNRVGPESEGIL